MLVLLTLYLSGRQAALGGVEKRWWQPVHSKILLEGILVDDTGFGEEANDHVSAPKKSMYNISRHDHI